MEICGVKFVPWNTPLKERLETLAAGGYLIYIFPFNISGPFVFCYLIMYTRFWIIMVLYLVWIFIIDKDTPEQGGRKCEWLRSWTLWKYNKTYFPHTLINKMSMRLDPKRNYLFVAFPHGYTATGIYLIGATNAGGFSDMFPYHESYTLILPMHFIIPFSREIVLALGCCACSKKSLSFLLGNPSGGKVAILCVGGAAEQMIAKSDIYQLVLKNRKGFAKLALQNGCPLVPVFTFGENDLYIPAANPEGSWLRKFQNWCKEKTTLFLPIVHGRGFFQYNFGFFPKKTPVNVVVGKPIEVAKVTNPTQEEIDSLHKTFIEELVKLYEENKHEYEQGREIKKLEII